MRMSKYTKVNMNYVFNNKNIVTLAKLEKQIDDYSEEIILLESLLDAKDDEEFWKIVYKNFNFWAFYEVISDCDLFGIKYKTLKTPYIRHIYYGTSSDLSNADYYENWIVYPIEDFDDSKVYSDEEIKNMLESNKIIILNKTYSSRDVKKQNNWILSYKNQNDITSPSYDTNEYEWYNSDIIMSKIREYILNNQNLRSRIELLNFRLLESLHLARKIIKDNNLDINIENSVEMKLRKNT